MAGRNKLPEGVVRGTMEVTRITVEEQWEFQAAAQILRKYRSDLLRDAIYQIIRDAKKIDPARFADLRRQFMETAEAKSASTSKKAKKVKAT